LTVTLPVALLPGVAVAVLCRYTGLKIWQAGICTVFGFVLAASALAPYVQRFLNELLRLP
jgi:hypothetical protein